MKRDHRCVDCGQPIGYTENPMALYCLPCKQIRLNQAKRRMARARRERAQLYQGPRSRKEDLR